MNPIGVHFIPTHTGKFHYDFIRDMQPGILKLCGSSTPDVQQIADGYAAAPNALMYLRNVARSEQHDFLWRDPVGAARQHVDEWHADIQRVYQQGRERGLTLPDKEQIRILGVNEPVIELFPRQEDMSNYDEWLAMMNERAPILDTYMVEFGDDANAHGYGTGLGNISSGQPANKKPGEYATFDWFPRTRKLLERTRGLNAYACHEYWRAETGPEGHADWHAWRFMHLNVDCDIDVLECGVDQQITSQSPLTPRGWHGHIEASAYVDQHRRYIARARTDSRFRCETPFTLDGDNDWESFWIEPCMPEMVGLSQELRASQPPSQPDSPPTVIRLPDIKSGKPTTFYVNVPAGARIRSAPEIDPDNPLIAVPYGKAVEVYGYTDDKVWAKVSYGYIAGWMSADLLSAVPPEEKEVEPPPDKPTGDNWQRSIAFVRKWEGGWADDPNDPGGATNKGITLATYKRWWYLHGGPVPTKEDLRNISDEEANNIYFRLYWKESGSDKLPWPDCLAVMDLAVNGGVDKAREFVEEVGTNYVRLTARRLIWYANLDGWRHFGNAWTRRCADLLMEASK